MSMFSDFSIKKVMSKEDDDEKEIQNNENGNDSSSSDSSSELSNIKDKKTNNGGVSGLKNSMIHECDYDISLDDYDYDINTELLKDFSMEDYNIELEPNFGIIEEKNEYKDEDEKEEDKYINCKNKNRYDIINCFNF